MYELSRQWIKKLKDQERKKEWKKERKKERKREREEEERCKTVCGEYEKHGSVISLFSKLPIIWDAKSDFWTLTLGALPTQS